MKLKKIFLLYILFISIFSLGQVGINTSNVNSNSILHISEKNDLNDVTNKGIMIPRLTESERDKLTYNLGTTDIRLTAVDNSLLIFNTTENCFNFWKSSESEWKSLCGSLGKAIFTIDCSNITVNGKYSNNVELTNSNNLRLIVNVTKPGSYDIIATTNNSNGYTFQASGTFLEAGTFSINLIGTGTPINPTPIGDPGDLISIYNSDNELLCNSLNIFINDSTIQPTFSVNCQSIVVNGLYTINDNLTAANTISINITSNSSAAGAAFEITTEEINGYSFRANGILNGGVQTINLIGQGKPVSNGINNFTLLTNSTLGSSSCIFPVKVAARKIKIVGLANTDYSYNIARSDNFLNKVLKNDNYFANNQQSTFPVNGFDFLEIGGGNLSSTSINNINAFNPDIIFIQYNYYSSNESDRIFLKSLLDKGVVVIYCSDGDSATSSRNIAAKDMINLALDTDVTVTSTVDSDLMQILDTGTTITSGPFMNLTGLSMGRDAGNNFGVSIIDFPFDKAKAIAYQDASQNSLRGFVSTINGFVFFGDGAPFAANEGTQAYNWPAKFKTTNSITTAIVNTYGTVPSYNSFLFLNLMAWAINYSQANKL